MFRKLGLKVNLVNTRQRLLEFLDDEISDALSSHLRDLGTLIRHGEQYDRIEGQADGVVLHLKSGKKLKTDILLWANGRTAPHCRPRRHSCAHRSPCRVQRCRRPAL